MRTNLLALGLGLAVLALGCGKSGEEAGREAARKQAEEEAAKRAASSGGAAKKLTPPVANRGMLSCDQLIDPATFQQAIGEAEAITVQTKKEPEAAASCSLIRGGKRPNEAEQKALIKKNGRLGVMPGDEICNISTFCWTIEDPEKFREKCHAMKENDDDSQGFYACVLIVATGADDVKRFRFYDDDTKCLIQVRGGPSNVDNDLIGRCAKAAHDLIGPDQIKPGGAPKGAAPAAEGSGSGA